MSRIFARITIKVDGEPLPNFPYEVGTIVTERRNFSFDNLDAADSGDPLRVFTMPTTTGKVLAFTNPDAEIAYAFTDTNGDVATRYATLHQGGCFLVINAAIVNASPVYFTSTTDGWQLDGVIGG